jgi:thiol-disulfide isomerase/thioredoxin
MFRRSIPESTAPPTVQRGGPSVRGAQETSALSAPVHICTNPASHRSLLETHRAVISFFTSAACGPCAVIRPLFEELAKEHEARDDMAFAMVDLGTGLGGRVASEWEVTVTPTFLFFFDGKLVKPSFKCL